MAIRYRKPYRLILIVLAGFIGVGTCLGLYGFRIWWTHRSFFHRGLTVMRHLAKTEPPAGVSKQEWDARMEYATNAYGNCFCLYHRVNGHDFQAFVLELERRSREPPSLELIQWIWDEVERIGVDGKVYASKYRPRGEGLNRRH